MLISIRAKLLVVLISFYLWAGPPPIRKRDHVSFTLPRSERVLRSQLSPDGRFLLVMGDKGGVSVGEVASGQWKTRLQKPGTRIRNPIDYPKAYLAGLLGAWTGPKPTYLYDSTPKCNWGEFAAFSPDGRYIVAPALGKGVRLWTWPEGKELDLGEASRGVCLGPRSFTLDGRYLILGMPPKKGGAFHFFDLPSRKLRRDLHLPKAQYLGLVRSLADGTLVFTTGSTMELYSPGQDRVLASFPYYSVGGYEPFALPSPDGRLLLLKHDWIDYSSGKCVEHHELIFWDLKAGKVLHTYAYKENYFDHASYRCGFTPDGRQFLFKDKTRLLAAMDLENFQVTYPVWSRYAQLDVDEDRFGMFGFLGEELFLVFAPKDKNISYKALWNTRRWEEIVSWTGEASIPDLNHALRFGPRILENIIVGDHQVWVVQYEHQN